jgi:hypothetical protein
MELIIFNNYIIFFLIPTVYNDIFTELYDYLLPLYNFDAYYIIYFIDFYYFFIESLLTLFYIYLLTLILVNDVGFITNLYSYSNNSSLYPLISYIAFSLFYTVLVVLNLLLGFYSKYFNALSTGSLVN